MSTKSKHTPGPWVLSEVETGHVPAERDEFEGKGWDYRTRTLKSDGVILGEVRAMTTFQFLHDFNQFEANAKLIAAAPELLEVLTTVYSSFKNRGFFAAGHDKKLGDTMYAAIKKATE